MAKELNTAKGGAGLPKKPPGPASASGPKRDAVIAEKKLSRTSANAGNQTVDFEEVDEPSVGEDAPAKMNATSPIGTETIASEEPMEKTPTPAKSATRAPGAAGAKAPAAGTKAATILDGKYKLLKKLGQGGMGAVYKAERISDGEQVAVKVLAKELVAKGNFVQRFQREIRSMEKVDHPNILRCLGSGEDKAKGFHYLVMEVVDGGSVEGFLKKLGKFSVGDAMHIIIKTTQALQHAHEKALIHRDIKPDNILLTRDGVLKLADLGLAKDNEDDVSLTKTGSGAGTPIYMAPEQARDVKHVDARVDIYALGIMLYVFLVGKAPFEGNTLVELITAKEKGKFDPMRKYNDEVPSKLDLIVDKMIAKDPKFRYASCEEVLAQLEPLDLAHEELSFLAPEKTEDDEEVEEAATPTPAPKGKQAPTQAPGRVAKKSVVSKSKGEARTNVPTEEEEAELNVWHWNLVTQSGKIVTKKLSIEQVRMLIKAGQINSEAQISRTSKGGFRAAATFIEFQAQFKSLAAATQANVKGQKYKDKFKELAEQDARRRKWGWLSRALKGFGSGIFGLLWIVLILAVVGAAGYFGWLYMNGKM